jgi:hypothetical protein
LRRAYDLNKVAALHNPVRIQAWAAILSKLQLIDDVRNQTPLKFGEINGLGKSKYSLPYLLKHGFEIVENEYQVILKRN